MGDRLGVKRITEEALNGFKTGRIIKKKKDITAESRFVSELGTAVTLVHIDTTFFTDVCGDLKMMTDFRPPVTTNPS